MSPAPTSSAVSVNGGDLRNRAGIASYTSKWNKDSAKDTAEDTQARKDVYTDVVNGWRDSALRVRMGNVFHFCRYYKGEAFYQAIARHEHFLAAHTGIKPGMRVLDVGCGVGGPAREIARFTDAEIVGLNNNAYQVSKATAYTKKQGLANQVSFVKGDFMKLEEQFGPNSFDAVYAIEATCHAPDWEGCYDQIKRVLKPGGYFGVYEWCMTDAWDPKDPHHKNVAHGIEVGDGIPEMRSIAACRDALKNVGFEIVHEEDLADRPDEIKWYYALEGDLRKIQTLWDAVMCWRMTTFGKFITQNTVWGLEKVGLVPKGTYDVGEALKTAADALVAGGREKLFTPMMNISKVGTTFLLPALLFTEIGPLATWENLKSYWPIIPASLIFQLISFVVGEGSHWLGMPQHYVPMFIFSNVTSLPLLLVDALGATGSLDILVPHGEVLADVLKRGRVYVLINALVGNLTRFAFGPYLMKTHKEIAFLHPHHDDPHHEPPPKLGTIALPTDSDDAQLVQGPESKFAGAVAKVKKWAAIALNPPLIGGFAAIFFGLIPWFHHQLFDNDGVLTPIADSVASVGNLYTALQMFVLGAHLYSKKGSSANIPLLTWLFAYRFFVAPAISISAIYGIRTVWPGLIRSDPILDFVLMLSNVGPPALTLSAIAELAHLPADVEGQIARIITLSYAVTPLICLPVTAALEVVERAYGLHGL
ncbi:hypothetical protein MNV49_005352 [Pseudohyphozyma bogoriensis]|nr:hypothetical protein MNV49_005352 [Pseudohyphozyma bogoriensis]